MVHRKFSARLIEIELLREFFLVGKGRFGKSHSYGNDEQRKTK